MIALTEAASIKTTDAKIETLSAPADHRKLKRGKEISVPIEEGKTRIVRLVNIGEPDKDGRRALRRDVNWSLKHPAKNRGRKMAEVSKALFFVLHFSP